MFNTADIPKELIPRDPRFGSGPSLVPPDHLERLCAQGPHYLGTGHRSRPLKKAIQEVRSGLADYFRLPDGYSVALGIGGSTLLFDMIGLGLVKKKSLHHTCGEFSHKWFLAHAAIPWIEAEEVAADFGEGISPEDRRDADFIACTLNETSTGAMIDSLPEVGEDTLLGIDATSGAGQCPCDLSKTDVFFFSPQKTFASEGGLFVCILSPKAKKRIEAIGCDQTRYIPHFMDWSVCLKYSEKNQTYSTPSLSTIFLLNEQIKRMNAFGGYEATQRHAREKAQVVYKWAEEKDYLSPYIRQMRYRSLSVCTIDVDRRYDVAQIIEALEKERIVYNIGSYRKLDRNQFRISVFHNIRLEDIQRLTKMLSFIIEKLL